MSFLAQMQGNIIIACVCLLGFTYVAAESQSRNLTVAAVQMSMAAETAINLDTAERLVRKAAAGGAQVVLLPELFAGPYFPIDQDPVNFARAAPVAEHPVVKRMSPLARELGVVLPLSIFERSGQVYFDSVAVVDADGSILGLYRKSHIPDGPGYQEKYYFSPGDTGFRVWNTRHGRLGVGVCWDQWFPETARSLALNGAELMLFPTAIGSDPGVSGSSMLHWRRVQQGHAGANMVPLVAANRFGFEKGKRDNITFYGSSFIADHTGDIVASASESEENVVYYSFDPDFVRHQRDAWSMFRDRRTDLYGTLLTMDGNLPKRAASTSGTFILL